MRIGIDARELCGHPTGVGRYLSGLLTAWAIDERASGHEFILYAPTTPAVTFDPDRFVTRITGGSGGTWWEQTTLPAMAARDRVDVFFAPAYSTALAHRMPTVVALHDLSFAAHPEWFTVREGARRRWLARQSAIRARAVVTISEFSKRELLERFNLADDRVHVIPPGVTSPGGSPAVLADRQTRGGPRVLYVGSIFNRRHVPDLIRAFAPIAGSDSLATLDLIGDNRTYPHLDLGAVVARAAINGQVRWKPYVSDDELAALYAAARAFAFLSEYEGLGLTPLEAMAAGVPSVLLDTAVARESCGDAALYVREGDLAATTAALRALLFDESTRRALLSAAPGVLARYNWPQAARATLGILEHSA